MYLESLTSRKAQKLFLLANKTKEKTDVSKVSWKVFPKRNCYNFSHAWQH